jgi:hypothetical protein
VWHGVPSVPLSGCWPPGSRLVLGSCRNALQIIPPQSRTLNKPSAGALRLEPRAIQLKIGRSDEYEYLVTVFPPERRARWPEDFRGRLVVGGPARLNQHSAQRQQLIILSCGRAPTVGQKRGKIHSCISTTGDTPKIPRIFWPSTSNRPGSRSSHFPRACSYLTDADRVPAGVRLLLRCTAATKLIGFFPSSPAGGGRSVRMFARRRLHSRAAIARPTGHCSGSETGGIGFKLCNR